MALTLPEIQEYLSTADLSRHAPLGITVLRNITVESLDPYLRYELAQSSWRATVQFGSYDNVLQEAMSAPPLFNESTKVVLLFTYLETLSPALAREFPALSKVARDKEVQRVAAYIDSVLISLRRQTSALLLWHSFECPPQPTQGILDSQDVEGQRATIENLNRHLQERLSAISNAYVLDTNLVLSRLGADRFYDLRYWHLAKAPYTREALRLLAEEQAKYIRAAHGKQKKCLVLDCDEILWGGVVGEEGTQGIKLGRDAAGSPYRDFQQEIANLASRGVILALCSKNNAEDVWDVFRNHSDMVLKESQVAAAQINWDDKATNLRRLAEQLNIGLDSMVFIDDSEFEANLVRQEVPEVTVLIFPKEASALFRQKLAACGLFDSLARTTEDRDRAAMYRQEAERKALSTTFTDLSDYLRSLEMVAIVAPVDATALARVAQLTQKTNQFNLTTRRYLESDIERFMGSSDYDVLTLQLNDKLGSSGLVGVIILHYNGSNAIFDTFLMSCRVLGRRVENVFLDCALQLAQQRGMAQALGHYRKTAKNGQVADFYARNGFELQNSSEEESWAVMALKGYQARPHREFKTVEFSPMQFQKPTTAY